MKIFQLLLNIFIISFSFIKSQQSFFEFVKSTADQLLDIEKRKLSNQDPPLDKQTELKTLIGSLDEIIANLKKEARDLDSQNREEEQKDQEIEYKKREESLKYYELISKINQKNEQVVNKRQEYEEDFKNLDEENEKLRVFEAKVSSLQQEKEETIKRKLQFEKQIDRSQNDLRAKVSRIESVKNEIKIHQHKYNKTTQDLELLRKNYTSLKNDMNSTILDYKALRESLSPLLKRFDELTTSIDNQDKLLIAKRAAIESRQKELDGNEHIEEEITNLTQALDNSRDKLRLQLIDFTDRNKTATEADQYNQTVYNKYLVAFSSQKAALLSQLKAASQNASSLREQATQIFKSSRETTKEIDIQKTSLKQKNEIFATIKPKLAELRKYKTDEQNLISVRQNYMNQKEQFMKQNPKLLDYKFYDKIINEKDTMMNRTLETLSKLELLQEDENKQYLDSVAMLNQEEVKKRNIDYAINDLEKKLQNETEYINKSDQQIKDIQNQMNVDIPNEILNTKARLQPYLDLKEKIDQDLAILTHDQEEFKKSVEKITQESKRKQIDDNWETYDFKIALIHALKLKQQEISNAFKDLLQKDLN